MVLEGDDVGSRRSLEEVVRKRDNEGGRRSLKEVTR